MKILKPELKPELLTNPKINSLYYQLRTLLDRLEEKKISVQTAESINHQVESINSAFVKDWALRKLLKEKQTVIVKLLEKEHKIVPKNYYRNIWLPTGMSVFGIPIGIAFGLSLGNIGLLGIGLPIGMAIGIAVGTFLDKKAQAEDRQLDVEIKY